MLIADGDEVGRHRLAAVVRAEGYDALLADCGDTALDAFRGLRPQFVLLDAELTGTDSFQVARQIKAIAGETFVPVILITASQAESDLWRCVDAGGDDILAKPWNDVILLAKLAALERQRQLHDTMLRQRDQIARHNAYLVHEQSAAKAVFDRVAHSGALNSRNIRYLVSPLAVFNGDVLFAAHTPAGGLFVFMGDFTGHGLTAGIGAMPLADVFYGMSQKGFRLEEVIRECNRKLHAVLPKGQFCCATMVDVNEHKRCIEYWNGGLPPGYLLRQNQADLVPLASMHLPLGIVDDSRFQSATEVLDFEPADRLLMFTDGLLESRDSGGQVYSAEQLEATLRGASGLADPFRAIQADAYDQIGAQDRDDDVTLIEVTLGTGVREPRPHDGQESPRASPPQNWRLTYELQAESLRCFNPLPVLQHLLMEFPELSEYGTDLYVILAETYNNALEHGVLCLDSRLKSGANGFSEYYASRERALSLLKDGFVRIDLDCRSADGRGELRIRVTDSGDGFPALKTPTDDASALHGRGLRLLHRLCASVRYTPPGNEVEAVFVWPPESVEVAV